MLKQDIPRGTSTLTYPRFNVSLSKNPVSDETQEISGESNKPVFDYISGGTTGVFEPFVGH